MNPISNIAETAHSEEHSVLIQKYKTFHRSSSGFRDCIYWFLQLLDGTCIPYHSSSCYFEVFQLLFIYTILHATILTVRRLQTFENQKTQCSFYFFSLFFFSPKAKNFFANMQWTCPVVWSYGWEEVLVLGNLRAVYVGFN